MKRIIKNTIEKASGRENVELVLRNCNIVNVFSDEIINGDLAIDAGIIIGIGDYQGDTEIDLAGKFLVPGLIDAHMHIESTMVTPSQFARAAVPRGTTTIIADPHEIANVCGIDGIKFLITASNNLPLDTFFMLPSCVPATPFEHSGAVLEANDLAELIDLPNVLGLGELMNYPGVIAGEKNIVDKLELSKSFGKIVDGHGPEISGKELNAYVIGGVKTDHECSTVEEMLNRIRKGMYISIREGTAARNLTSLIKGVTPQTERRCIFCTDDRHPEGILKDGHIDNNVRLAIEQGIDPISAIRMATLNACECYGLKNKGAIAPGCSADLIVVDDLQKFNILKVFKNGKLVAENYTPLFDVGTTDYSNVSNTVHIKPIQSDSLAIKLNTNTVNVMQLQSHSILTKKVIRKIKPDQNGFFKSDKADDILKIAVVERHHATGNIGLGLVENFGLKGGAIASTVANDSHNIVVIGDNDPDMLAAINEVVRVGGGITLVSNRAVLKTLALPIAGLISDLTMEEVNAELVEMLEIAYNRLEVNQKLDPFMTLAFLALPVIPEVKITDKGFFDVTNFEFIDICVADK